MNSPSADSASKVVVVTGASSGIGRQTALAYAGRRARLVVAARGDAELQSLADECLRAGAIDVLVKVTDIADAGQVQSLFDAAVAHFGRIDVAIQSAAITTFGRFEDIPAEVFDGVVRTNLLGAANVARCALIHFQARRTGHLVLIGSLLGFTAVPYQSAYVASKFALTGLVRALRQENRHLPDVSIHGIYPGPVDTAVYATASNYYGKEPRVPPTAVSPSTVVATIIRATDRRRSSERQVGWGNRTAIIAYRLFPAIFDAAVGPFLRRVAFSSLPAERSSGNAFGPPSADPGARRVRS